LYKKKTCGGGGKNNREQGGVSIFCMKNEKGVPDCGGLRFARKKRRTAKEKGLFPSKNNNKEKGRKIIYIERGRL